MIPNEGFPFHRAAKSILPPDLPDPKFFYIFTKRTDHENAVIGWESMACINLRGGI
jgi:hypothetical protein